MPHHKVIWLLRLTVPLVNCGLSIYEQSSYGSNDLLYRLSPVSDFSSGVIQTLLRPTPCTLLLLLTTHCTMFRWVLIWRQFGDRQKPLRLDIHQISHIWVFRWMRNRCRHEHDYQFIYRKRCNFIHHRSEHLRCLHRHVDRKLEFIEYYPFTLASGTTYYVRVKTNLVPEWGPTKNFSTTNGARIASDRSRFSNQIPISWFRLTSSLTRIHFTNT